MASDPPRKTLRKSKRELAAEARLSAVLESISDIFYAVDREWRIVLFNRAAEEFFGAPRGEILGRNLWELFPFSETEFGRLLRQAMDERQPGRMTAPSALRAGRWVEVRFTPLGDNGVGVALNDVTERQEAERAVKRSEERLELAVNAHAIGIFDWQVLSGRVLWSPEEEAMFGFAPGTFPGTQEAWQRHVFVSDLAQLDADLKAAIAARRERLRFQYRIRRADGPVRWIEGAARLLYRQDGRLQRVVGTNMDVTERKLAEEHQRLLINELNHRVKNTLAIVQAIAWQSLRGGAAPTAVREAFEGRLAALATAHDVLTRQNWEAAGIDEIIRGATAPHDPGEGRLSACGPAVELPPKTAVALALAMHELATNAVKHGALSGPGGRVVVRWTVEAGRLRLSWSESGGPLVAPPAQRGFGARLLEQGLAEELGGTVRLDFRPEGLVCTVDAPFSQP
jgi:PAS domain S-box-containing protein